jgi:hypothetical protein
MRNNDEKNAETPQQIDGQGTLESLLMYVVLGMFCAGVFFCVMPYCESVLELPILFPAAIALVSLWQSFGFYKDLSGVLKNIQQSKASQ